MENSDPYYAIAVVKGTAPDGVTPITGTVQFTQRLGQQVQITVNVTGLPKGDHGFHVHEFGDLSNGCTSAGAHYNPLGLNHGGPGSEIRHVGDLGNLTSDGTNPTVVTIQDHLVNIYGNENNVVGRSVVLHADPDDLGLGG